MVENRIMRNESKVKKFSILYLVEATSGGIAEYAVRQVHALHVAGANVTVMCRPEFPVERLRGCRVEAVLPVLPTGISRWRKLQNRIKDGRSVAKAVASVARDYDVTLMACYSEYLSPFWAPIYQRLAKQGVSIATIAHDPVRDFVLGPLWWHRWSVRQGYSFVSDTFVHDDTQVDFGGKKPRNIRVHRIPHGLYELTKEKLGREKTREKYGLASYHRVFLAFGQIRDGKNLDRFLRAMVSLPGEVKLLVAGSSESSSQHSPDYYLKLASELGVADRCVWDLRYIPDEEIGDIFAAADFMLMTYSSKFRSASGVMNSAVASQKPILGSSGPGPFRTSMLAYQLGVFVEPDNDYAILEGAKNLLETPVSYAQWDRYSKENSWEENARLVIKALSKH